MKLAIIGAGAGIGLEAVTQALEKGHEVTALSTNTSRIPDHPLLTKINGSAASAADLKRVLPGNDAILITVGTKNKKATTLFSDIAKALIQTAEETGFYGPIITITGFGAGESKNYLDLFMRSVIRFFLKDQYINKTRMEELIVNSSLKWEIVRPGMLSIGEITKTYKVLTKLEKGMRIRKISRADVAHFLVNEAENKQFLGQFVTLTN